MLTVPERLVDGTVDELVLVGLLEEKLLAVVGLVGDTSLVADTEDIAFVVVLRLR